MHCGKELSIDSPFCPNCGKPLESQKPNEKTLTQSETEKSSRPTEAILLIILFFVNGLGWMALGLLYGAMFAFFSAGFGAGIFSFGVFMGVIAWMIALGLLLTKKWAHTLALIFAVISLFLFPIGTITGIISIWLLLKENVKKAYGKT